jgi:hypothetical protein
MMRCSIAAASSRHAPSQPLHMAAAEEPRPMAAWRCGGAVRPSRGSDSAPCYRQGIYVTCM